MLSHIFKTIAWLIIAFLIFIIPSGDISALTSNWQKGLTLRLVNQDKSEVDQSLKWIANDHANFVTITPGWLTDSKTSSNIDRKPRTPSDELLAYTIDKAHSLGLQIMLKPHLDIKGGKWRANLAPVDRKNFFDNYSKMMLNYAKLSQTHGVEQFSVGAELYSLTMNPDNEPYWRSLISKIKTAYNGKLTYSANSFSEHYDEGGLPFWDMLDYIGLSMYYPLADNSSPTLDQLLQQWQKIEQNYIYPLQQKINKPIIAAEIGYRSVDGAIFDPGNYSFDAGVDLGEQADLYKAFFEFWKDKDYFKGVHFWDWEIDQNAGGNNDKGYTVQNKPAEDILKYYFSDQGTGSASINTASLIKNANTSNSDKLSADPVGTDNGKIIIKSPENNSIISGEKKIKIYIEDRNPETYIATYNVDQKGEILMENANPYFKQAKIQFDSWTWNGGGPYNIIFTARDLNGKLINTASITLFVKH
ncbi:MAG: Uncharacterized protein G01um10142_250 [Parcubacteria group bacterium Gr01-1014_2]|nr:MAG: Uncharacterized protein G01um10142_250 [Parcubacteria group bacterium Gr01-1014_2]